MRAGDLMRTKVLTFRPGDPVEEVLDVLVGEHIHGAPVVGDDGRLVGVISQLDIHFGAMSRREGIDPASGEHEPRRLLVRDVMTSPAVAATEDTEIVDLCRMMYRLRIHRVPVVSESKVEGIISSLDICNAIGSGKLALTDSVNGEKPK